MFELYKNAAATVPSASTNRVRLYVDTDGLPYVKDNTGAITPLKGDTGSTGATGATGAGVPVGGTTNQVLAKASATNYDTAWVTPIQSVSGTSPVVSSGGTTPAISLASGYGDTQNPYASNTANYVLATPNGTAGVPTFRAIVAADIPTLNQNTTGTAANVTDSSNITLVTLSALSLPYSQLSGTVPTWNQNTTGTAANITASSNATLTTLSSLSLPGSQVSGDISGNAANVTASSNSTLTTLSALSLPGSQVSGNISGNAANVTGTVAVANGGTGAALTTSNFVFAGPSSGSPAAPSFRALTTADIAGLSSGSVTSVALALPSIMTVSGSPVTSTGTLTGTLTTQAVNAIFAGPSSGAAAAPTFRSLTTADIPTLNQNTTGTAANVTGIVAVANGGTGQATASAAFNSLSPVTTTGDLIIGNGTNSATRLAIGTNSYVLTSNGTTATWAAATGGVSQIVAGTNVTISPVGGTGVVTINASGGGSSSAYTRTTFTATAGQTAFTVTYAVGYLQVYVNGVLLTGSDYTATSGTGFTLNVACAVGDIVEALVITTSVTGITTSKSIAMALIFGY